MTFKFEIIAQCRTTRARASRMTLPHGTTNLPAFMAVATQAAIKGLTPQQVCLSLSPTKKGVLEISIGRITGFLNLVLTASSESTYHLALRPGTEILDAAGGAHQFQGWSRNLLTDSGGFQLVSLVKFSTLTEEGVVMQSPFNQNETMTLSPEESMRIQHSIGADIMMQLDDVIVTTSPDLVRMEDAMWRSVRWLDRCIAYHKKMGKDKKQNLFAIIQGGLDPTLRGKCLDAMIQRSPDLPGFAIGGLSGGEAKDSFWKVVAQCTDKLPHNKPRYCMGVGFSEDLVVCMALGIDMADCVFPTRTARFGIALTFDGPLNLALRRYANDFDVIDKDCTCPTCRKGQGMTRSALHSTVSKLTTTASALTLHNLAHQLRLMDTARQAVIEDRFPQFLKDFFRRYYIEHSKYPSWAVDALLHVGVDLMEDAPPGSRSKQSQGTKWDYAKDGLALQEEAIG